MKSTNFHPIQPSRHQTHHLCCPSLRPHPVEPPWWCQMRMRCGDDARCRARAIHQLNADDRGCAQGGVVAGTAVGVAPWLGNLLDICGIIETIYWWHPVFLMCLASFLGVTNVYYTWCNQQFWDYLCAKSDGMDSRIIGSGMKATNLGIKQAIKFGVQLTNSGK